MNRRAGLLALDLGITTGVAVLSLPVPADPDDLGIVAHGTISLDSLEHTLKHLLLEYMPRKRVVEEPIIIRGPLGDSLEHAMAICRRVIYPFQKITPAQWKSHPLAKTPLPRGISIHERDAIRLGLVVRSQLVDS